MKGLIIKDVRLLLQQKSTLFMFLGIGLFLMLTGNNILAVVNYMIYVTAMYTMSAIAYDTSDNGMAFLMTLPVSRRDYVIGKYLLVFCSASLVGTAFAIAATVVSLAYGNTVDIGMLGGELLVSVLFMMVIFSVMLPVNIKYGAEKSRIVSLLGFGIVFAVIYLLNKLGADGGAILENALQKLEQLKFPVLILIGGVLVGVIVCVSVIISSGIMQKKEF